MLYKAALSAQSGRHSERERVSQNQKGVDYKRNHAERGQKGSEYQWQCIYSEFLRNPTPKNGPKRHPKSNEEQNIISKISKNDKMIKMAEAIEWKQAVQTQQGNVPQRGVPKRMHFERGVNV